MRWDLSHTRSDWTSKNSEILGNSENWNFENLWVCKFSHVPVPVCRYVEMNGSAAILATKRSADVAPEVNLREHVTHTPPSNVNKAAHYGFETQRRRHQKPKNRGISGPTKRTYVHQIFFKKKSFPIFSSIWNEKVKFTRIYPRWDLRVTKAILHSLIYFVTAFFTLCIYYYQFGGFSSIIQEHKITERKLNEWNTANMFVNLDLHKVPYD